MKKSIVLSVALLLCGLLIYSSVNMHDLNEENSRLYEQISRYEQSALDWQTKAEGYEIKLLEAQTDLELCSKEIERLETIIYEQEQTISGLESETESLETIVSNYNESGERDSDYTDEDKTILAATMYAENYISGRYEMMLTGSVVINRKNSPRFPNTIKDVVFQIDGEYEQYAKRTKNIVERVLRGEETIPSECYDLAEILLKYGSIAPPKVQYQAHFNQGDVFWEWKGEQFCYGR